MRMIDRCKIVYTSITTSLIYFFLLVLSYSMTLSVVIFAYQLHVERTINPFNLAYYNRT